MLAALPVVLLLNDGREYESEKLLRMSFLQYKVFILFAPSLPNDEIKFWAIGYASS